MRHSIYHLGEKVREKVAAHVRDNNDETQSCSSRESGRSDEDQEGSIMRRIKKLLPLESSIQRGSISKHDGRKKSLGSFSGAHDSEEELEEFQKRADISMLCSEITASVSSYSSVCTLTNRNQISQTSARTFHWEQLRARNRASAKRALIIGIDYWASPVSSDVLGGCYKDCQLIYRALLEEFGFSENQIVVLNDYRSKSGKDLFPHCHRHEEPTRENIIFWMFKWLTRGARSGETMFLYYCGHGGQQECRHGNEIDGLDEVLLPADFRTRRIREIVDDEIHDEVVKKVPPGCFLFALVDCCHSETLLDLAYVAENSYTNSWKLVGEEYFNCIRATKAQVDYSPRMGSEGGQVISLAGTTDAGQSMEILTDSGPKGMLTGFFLEILQEYRTDKRGTLTYGYLMRSLHAKLKEFKDHHRHEFDQLPALSASQPFDLESPFCL